MVTPEHHRMYASPVVPLIRFEKAIYTNAEQFIASVEVANFSGSALQNIVPIWNAKDSSGKVVFSGELNSTTIAIGNGIQIGKIELPLASLTKATELTIELQLQGTAFLNRWKIWVYPSKLNLEDKEIVFTTSFNEAMKHLRLGKKVLLNPDTAQIKGVEGRFAPVFWSPVHFPNQPGTMGLLCNPKHSAFAHFPTDFYSDWQWWDLITSSKTMIIDSLPKTEPLVRIIDNFYKNRKMANVIEAKVGKGKLILASLDLSKNLDKRLPARQLRYSVEQYMKTKDFSPTMELTAQQLAELLK